LPFPAEAVAGNAGKAPQPGEAGRSLGSKATGLVAMRDRLQQKVSFPCLNRVGSMENHHLLVEFLVYILR